MHIPYYVYLCILYLIVVLEDTPSGTLSTDTSVIMDDEEAQQQLQANESDEGL